MPQHLLNMIQNELDAARRRVTTLVQARNALLRGMADGQTPTPGMMMTDGTIYAGVSPDTGQPLCAMPFDMGDPHSWGDAKALATRQTFANKMDWRLPTKAELAVLYENRSVIDGFKEGFYWAATESNCASAWCQSFSNGRVDESNKLNFSRVRYVRTAKA